MSMPLAYLIIHCYFSDDKRGKENQSWTNSTKSNKGPLLKRPLIDSKSSEKRLDPQKLQVLNRFLLIQVIVILNFQLGVYDLFYTFR